MKVQRCVGSLTAVAAAVVWSMAGAAEAPSQHDASKQRELLDQYCVTCHNFSDTAGGLDLFFAVHLDESIVENAEIWERSIRKLRAGTMPPPGEPRPVWDEYVALTEWLESEIDAAAAPLPGSKPMHRLNRSEYANVVRDLLGVEIDAADFLPPDNSARGFDNIAGSLEISRTLLESYSSAAGRIARLAVGYWQSPTERNYIAPGDVSQNHRLEGLPFGTRGGMAVRHTFPADGEYLFRLQNFGVGNFMPGERLELSIDGERVGLFDYTGVGLATGMGGDRDGEIETTVFVKAGTRLVGATFVAENYRPGLDLIRQYDRKSIENNSIPQLQYHPVVGLMRIQGPFNAERPSDSASLRQVYSCRPASEAEEAACAREILTTLARRAYRRPVNDADLEALRAFYELGRSEGGFEDGIELAIRRLLVDPEFLVRTEHEPPDVGFGEAYRITDLELASRLSFFLWSSIPDDELIELAAAGRLSEPAALEAQVRRMLADPRAGALVANFAQQWLHLRNLPAIAPSGIYYPDWDDELRQGFRRETELLFASIVREDRSIIDLLDADYTFVNERLARHYGIPNIYGSHFRRVTLGPELDYRRGLLGQGSFLSVTSTENYRTSPVGRGVWVLENLLGTPPPAPPPDVPPLEEAVTSEAQPIRTLREQMIRHNTDEACRTCHLIMDPIGFALENFDATGRWRDTEGHPRLWGGEATPIDARVTLWDGTEAVGPVGLREALLRYSPQFARFATEKLMTYALGRGVEHDDMPLVRAIVRDAEAQDYRFSSLVMGIVTSPAFQMRTRLEEDI